MSIKNSPAVNDEATRLRFAERVADFYASAFLKKKRFMNPPSPIVLRFGHYELLDYRSFDNNDPAVGPYCSPLSQRLLSS